MFLRLVVISVFFILNQAQIYIPHSFWAPPIGVLVISDGPAYNFGLLPTNTDIDRTFTVTNIGDYITNNMTDDVFSTTRFDYKGGSYPGTGGTCGSFLSSGSNCTIVITANSATAATFNDTITINYSNGRTNTSTTRDISAQFTATTFISIFVLPDTGNFQISDTQQLNCYGNTSDGGTVLLTSACSWSSSNSGLVSVDNLTNKGLITGVANGVGTIITATYGALSDTATIDVNGSPPSFPDDGIGLHARYYTTLSGGGTKNDPYSVLQNQRIDANVDFNWGAGSNPAGGADDFGAIWTGQIRAPTTATYCVQTRSDDGVRLWIDNTLVVNNWTDHGPTNNNGNFAFTANQKYNIILEFYENGGGAEIRLRYISGACGTPSAVAQVNLYPQATQALDIQQNVAPRWTNLRRGFALNGTVGAIANGASITGISGSGGPSPANATASNANGTGMSYVSSDRSQGVSFDGIDDYISVAASVLATGNGTRTTALWVKATSTGATMPVTFYGNNTNNNGHGIEILSDGKIRHSIIGTFCTSTGSITFDEYNHVAVTLNGTAANIYINGQLDSSCTMGATPNTSSGSTLYIGRDIAGTSLFTGELDDIAYWNIVLDSGEINSLYVKGKIENPF